MVHLAAIPLDKWSGDGKSCAEGLETGASRELNVAL